jgi:DNA-directed RNA polymerase sigma subunit (sigma70/sigma32)
MDGQKTQKRNVYMSLSNGLVDLYEGDNKADIDSRYQRDEVISDASFEKSITSLALLSSELNSDKYKIRTPEQQADWTKRKSSCQKQLAKYLLRMDSVVVALIEKCNGSENHLMGTFIDNGNGVRIKYDESLQILSKNMLTDYLAGVSDLTIDNISNIIVDDYNLSYSHFVKIQALKKLSEFKILKKYDDDVVLVPEDIKPLTTVNKKLTNYASEQGLSWNVIKGIMRNVRVLHISITQFRERLVSTNLRSCLSNAFSYYHGTGGSRNSGFDSLDLVSEASIGLMHACDMYIYGIDARFTTYADFWIKLRVSRYIKNNNAVRVPIHVTEEVNRIMLLLKNFINKGDEFPSKETVEALSQTRINDAIWQLASNRFKGVSTVVSCVTNSGDDENYSFDSFTEAENKEDVKEASKDANIVLKIAKSLITDDPNERCSISQEQYDFLLMKYVDDLTNTEIAGVIGGAADAKYVRTLVNEAIQNIKAKLKV